MPSTLNVIALISGGKDSFFSLLHCHAHTHRVVALANLHAGAPTLDVLSPPAGPREVRPPPEAADLNSFMYQTVGHGVIPLYAAATGLPVYRMGIRGAAAQSGRDYDGGVGRGDETESMTELLREVMARHPEADAVCAGAILSTYQRTRVESVAVRLGLVPLAYLWKYPSLPAPGDDAQLLRDMAAAGLDARIVKVASAGLDEGLLWERISSEAGITKARKGLRFFGGGEGAVLGEGGEFETVVVDGPRGLFRGRVVVGEGGWEVVREGGGCSWLRFREARVEAKQDGDGDHAGPVRMPELLDAKFASTLEIPEEEPPEEEGESAGGPLQLHALRLPSREGSPSTSGGIHWGCIADPRSLSTSIEDEAKSVMDQIADHIHPHPPTCITNTTVLLRRMADFPAVNKIYGTLFPFPNPPSRVTISCGDLLPQDHSVAVYVNYQPGLEARDRNGLHVQSRSYWAPANIGPYSQAIDVPLLQSHPTDSSAARGPRCVAMAGQIPLIPATMDLPSPNSPLQLSVALSLQHLWRIAVEMKVQLWTSAVAYFPRTSTPDEMARGAAHAGAAWRRVHSQPNDDEDDDPQSGPDLWDRRFNTEYMTVGDAPAGPTPLPDWEIFADEESPGEPPLFAVEVEELPRGAAVEWQAHAGLAGIEAGAVEMGVYSGVSTAGGEDFRWRSHLLVVRIGQQVFVHGTVSIEPGAGEKDDGPLDSVFEAIWKDSVVAAGVEKKVLDKAEAPRPYLVYGALADGRDGNQTHGRAPAAPFIPCRSIWTVEGKRVHAVALFRYAL